MGFFWVYLIYFRMEKHMAISDGEGGGELDDLATGFSVDADGVIQKCVPGKKKTVFRQPAMMEHALAGAISSMRRVVDALVDVDVTIAAYADLLARAQPLNSGRIVIVFSKSHRVRNDEKVFFDIIPVPMRMVLYVSGTWHLRRPPPFKKLEELRVGQGAQSDRLVVQVLRELDKLFAARAKLMTYLSDFRVPVVPDTRSAVAQSNASLKRLGGLHARLRLDWKEDAKGCREAIRNERKCRAEAKKKNPPKA